MHLLPFLMVGMTCAFLDRVNIGFAALQMNADLAVGPAAFGFAAGVFFLGYFAFEVPSNLMMAKFGPRKWLTRIMFTWGIVAGLTAFCGNAKGLYVMRFLLGVAEAGFFPGLILYITYWFRTEDTAQAVSWLFMGSVTGIIIVGRSRAGFSDGRPSGSAAGNGFSLSRFDAHDLCRHTLVLPPR